MRKFIYDRILERKDNRRPFTLEEIYQRFDQFRDCFVMDIKIVSKKGTSRISWSEKEANEMEAIKCSSQYSDDAGREKQR